MAPGLAILLPMSSNSLTQSTYVAASVADSDVAAVREFNRFYTSVLGLLREGLLDTPYSLTEARIIFELARQDEVEVAAAEVAADVDGILAAGCGEGNVGAAGVGAGKAPLGFAVTDQPEFAHESDGSESQPGLSCTQFHIMLVTQYVLP